VVALKDQVSVSELTSNDVISKESSVNIKNTNHLHRPKRTHTQKKSPHKLYLHFPLVSLFARHVQIYLQVY
jgi:hypothetical protein